MPILIRNGKTRKIKNLGWLLRNWKEVASFEVGYHCGTCFAMALIAHLKCNGKYFTPFTSKEVLRLFLDRPVFRGLSIDWFGQKYKVGKIPDERSGAN